jgi:hypothetical protein
MTKLKLVPSVFLVPDISDGAEDIRKAGKKHPKFIEAVEKTEPVI